MTTPHSALPPRVSRPWVGLAVAVWIGASIVSALSLPEHMAQGEFTGEGTVVSDPYRGRWGRSVLLATEPGTLLAELDDDTIATRGDRVVVKGRVSGEPGRRGHLAYRATIRISQWQVSSDSHSLPLAVGDAVRSRVIDRLWPLEEGNALLAGFLIGDTSGIDPADVDAMRKSGLSHFVAVSGSNVALWLGLVALAAGPLALGARRRAVVGLVALPIYAAATRFEPSVMRASVMAGLALGGRLVGVVLEAWQLLSAAVIILLVLDPSLTSSVGFQLSVAATVGVLIGARWPTSSGRVGRAIAITVGAQALVAPLLLVHFGSVPVLSPLINLVVAPLVATSTVVGAVGVIGPPFLIDVASSVADLVLIIARGSALWPQLDAWALLAVGAGALVAAKWSTLRPALAVTGSVVLALLILGHDRGLPEPGVVVLDVGQGDAIVLNGGGGHMALVDGGPDSGLLIGKLRSYGITHFDLVVLSHVHADHATGLVGIVGKIGIERFWAATSPHTTPMVEGMIDDLARLGIPTGEPTRGQRLKLGSLVMVVEGPIRRYASPNDQSIVLTVSGPARSMLLTGDIETFAQKDLALLRADVLKVPHQGAATSDESWLSSVGADLAVISVGPNQYGHPADWVIQTLEETGAEVVRTDVAGDVVVPLG